MLDVLYVMAGEWLRKNFFVPDVLMICPIRKIEGLDAG